MSKIYEKIKQYKNLIFLILIIVLICIFLKTEFLMYIARRNYEISALQNKIIVEQAETEQRISLIKANTQAELVKIWKNEKELKK